MIEDRSLNTQRVPHRTRRRAQYLELESAQLRLHTILVAEEVEDVSRVLLVIGGGMRVRPRVRVVDFLHTAELEPGVNFPLV